MGINMRLRKWGNRLAVCTPKTIADQWGVSEGSAIEMALLRDQVVLRKQACNLIDLLSKVRAENLHTEQDMGESCGSNQW